jgi:hypothetical protein
VRAHPGLQHEDGHVSAKLNGVLEVRCLLVGGEDLLAAALVLGELNHPDLLEEARLLCDP